MAVKKIPVYDICQISNHGIQQDLLIERLGTYIDKHYTDLHRPHRHSFYHFVLFTKGGGTHSIDFVKFAVRAFEMYFMIPGQVHSWSFEGATDGYLVHFNEQFFSTLLKNSDYLERFPFFNGISEDGVRLLPADVQASVIEIFETLLKEITTGQVQDRDFIRVLLLELFFITDRSGISKRTGKKMPPQKSLLFRNFQQLIGKHFRTIKLPKEYAELLYITPNHLNALCQDLVGKTSGEMIRDRILLEAKRLLTNADMSITELAYDLNFQDNSYFNRFFKKYTGFTPEEFRNAFAGQ